MGVQEMALMLLGIGIISEQFGGGEGLISLGKGVQTIVAAPLTGTGTGLASLAGGLKTLAESFGDIGRGLAALFESIPRGPFSGIPFAPISENGNGTLPPSGGNGPPPLIAMSTDSGGSGSTLLSGGGGNVPGASFSFVEPSAFIRSAYAVAPGFHAGLGVPGYWVSNTPLQDKPAGGSTMI